MAKQALTIAISVLLCGCTNLAYYAQAIGGHLKVMQSAQPITRLLDSSETSPELRAKLEKIRSIRDFASRELFLPDNGSYRSYGDLGRPYVVWNVFAAREFSVELENWCFFLVGCVNYRGYYNQDAAETFARQMQNQGLETYVAPIPAYSTLGFFDDPVLNTFLRQGEQEVARTVFHELAHQVVFVKGDSTFNESFATAVENEGMRRWLTKTATQEQLHEFNQRQERRLQFLQLMSEHREQLEELYSKPMAPDEKRLGKSQILADLKQAYAKLRGPWGSHGSHDPFGSQGLNNARLGSISLYTRQLPAFEALLAEAAYDLPTFYRRATELAKLRKAERQRILEHLQDLAKGSSFSVTSQPR